MVFYPPLARGEVVLLPLAKGGREGFYDVFFKPLKCYQKIYLYYSNPSLGGY